MRWHRTRATTLLVSKASSLVCIACCKSYPLFVQEWDLTFKPHLTKGGLPNLVWQNKAMRLLDPEGQITNPQLVETLRWEPC